jgi:hypothetical protein
VQRRRAGTGPRGLLQTGSAAGRVVRDRVGRGGGVAAPRRGAPGEKRRRLVVSTGDRAGAGYLGARARQHRKDFLDRRGKLYWLRRTQKFPV